MPLPRTTRRKAIIGIGGAAAMLATTAALAVAQADVHTGVDRHLSAYSSDSVGR